MSSTLFVEQTVRMERALPAEVQVARDRLRSLAAVWGKQVWAPQWGLAYNVPSLEYTWQRHPAASGHWEMLYGRVWNLFFHTVGGEPFTQLGRFDPLTVWWEPEHRLQEQRVQYLAGGGPGWLVVDLLMIVLHRNDWRYLDVAYRHVTLRGAPYDWRRDAFRWTYNNWVQWASPYIGNIAPVFLRRNPRTLLYPTEPLGDGDYGER